MRNRPKKEKEFIKGAIVDQSEKGFEIDYTNHLKWPLFSDDDITPTMTEGAQLRKPMTLPLKEYEWNTIDAHTKKLGVQKAEWIRYAIFRLLCAEQEILNTHYHDS